MWKLNTDWFQNRWSLVFRWSTCWTGGTLQLLRCMYDLWSIPCSWGARDNRSKVFVHLDDHALVPFWKCSDIWSCLVDWSLPGFYFMEPILSIIGVSWWLSDGSWWVPLSTSGWIAGIISLLGPDVTGSALLARDWCCCSTFGIWRCRFGPRASLLIGTSGTLAAVIPCWPRLCKHGYVNPACMSWSD